MAACPSNSHEQSRNGRIGTRALQTTNDMMLVVPAFCMMERLVILPHAHEKPAAKVNRRAISGISVKFPVIPPLASTNIPAAASRMPTIWLRLTFSPRIRAPSSTLKKTCDCKTTEAIPDGIPRLIAQNKKANCAKLIVRP